MNKNKTILINQQDFYTLFNIHEQTEELESLASKCDAIIDVLSEALERMNDCGTKPVDDRTIINVVDVIREYSSDTKYGLRKLENKLSIFNHRLKDQYEMQGGERCE